jgi:hypothetical protein
MQESLAHTAYQYGVHARVTGKLRVSPFYNEKMIGQDGSKIDITSVLDAFWYAGYDGEVIENAEIQVDALPQ